MPFARAADWSVIGTKADADANADGAAAAAKVVDKKEPKPKGLAPPTCVRLFVRV